MSTKYTITVGGEVEARATRTNKAKALEFAQAIRNDERVAVEVATQTGTVVASFDAPKKIKMSAPYTRVVALPSEVEFIDGRRVAYKRGRPGAQFALLDANKGEYAIWDVDLHVEVDIEVATTREAGRWFADERVAYRAANPVA